MTPVTLAHAKAHLSELLDRVKTDGDTISITRRGKPHAPSAGSPNRTRPSS